jgi:soluble lytic murein transglycosylase
MWVYRALLSAGFLLLAATGARADCTSASSPFDQVYCDIQVFHQADHQLNTDYADLAKMLNPAEKSSLRSAEIAWIKDRNDKCTMTQDGYDFVAMDCATDETSARDDFIKARARECSSTGCVDSELAKESD